MDYPAGKVSNSVFFLPSGQIQSTFCEKVSIPNRFQFICLLTLRQGVDIIILTGSEKVKAKMNEYDRCNIIGNVFIMVGAVNLTPFIADKEADRI